MKTILLRNNQIGHYADSALGRDAMPLFLSEHNDSWQGEIALAFRIGRLGKNVAQKFALRYADAATVAMVLHCPGDPSWLGIADYAVTPGAWQEMAENWNFGASIGEIQEHMEIADEQVRSALAQAIAKSSQYATLKTGDIILPDLPSLMLPLSIDKVVETKLNSLPCMKLKIK